ncbi:MAG: DUF3006 domain-containing protein [Myxococcota bacterium]|nr:DUF3006 domain-containing protein [Myxococcota bacterium]
MMFLDRIEGDRAIVEFDGESIAVPVVCLPDGVVEGHQLTWTASSSPARTDAARDRLKRLAERDSGDMVVDL